MGDFGSVGVVAGGTEAGLGLIGIAIADVEAAPASVGVVAGVVEVALGAAGSLGLAA